MSLSSFIGSGSTVPSIINKDLTLNGILGIVNQTASYVPLTVTGATGQTGNLFELKNVGGTTVFSVDVSGNVSYLGTEYITDSLNVTGNIVIGGTTMATGVLTSDSGIVITAGGLSVVGNSSFGDETTIHTLTVQGELKLESGYIRSKYSANIHLLPSASCITIIGDAGTTSNSLVANDDLMITGKCEVDGLFYPDGGISATSGGIEFNEGATNYFLLLKYPAVTRPMLAGMEADGATAIGLVLGAYADMPTSGAKVVSFRDNIVNGTGGDEKSFIDRNGTYYTSQSYFSSVGMQNFALYLGTATIDTGAITMIKGAQAGDPQVAMALSADVNGDFSITTSVGDITLQAQDDIALNAVGGSVTITPTAGTGIITTLTVTGAAHTAITTTAESIGMNFNFSATKTWATGDIATQREILIQAPIYAFAGASMLSTAVTLAISGSPSAGANATIVNARGLLVGNPVGVTANLVSAGGFNYQAISAGDHIIAMSGTTQVTSLKTAQIGIGILTIDDQADGALTIDYASGLYIAGAPVAQGGSTITLTNAYAIWSDSGLNRFDGDVNLGLGGGARLLGGGIQMNHQVLAAGVDLTMDKNDGVVEVVTDNVANSIITLPACSGNEGMMVSVYLITDGGTNAVVTRAGADVIQNGSADLANTTVTLDDAGDFVMLQCVTSSMWQILGNSGGTVA